MQFFPHKTSVNTTATAVSASIALTGSFIGNFSAIAINRIETASIALNITGSRGTDGTSATIIGPTGPQGARGVTGFRGRNIFLLSSSWEASACAGGGVTCFGGTGGIRLFRAGPGTECNLSGGSVYNTSYAGGLGSVTNGAADGSILFSDRTCSTVAAGVSVHNFSRIFYTDGAGVISSVACTEPVPVVCNGPYTLYDSAPDGLNYTCGGGASTSYYTNYNGDPELSGLTGANGAQANGFVLYTGRVDGVCTGLATNLTKHNGSGAAFITNGSGAITYVTCSS